jgi:GrpB-like predicted nucleotidyltransferase (UPF0157 family)
MSEAPIELVEYTPRWVELFDIEREVLKRGLQNWLVGIPEHIGSTAVPSLAAKPIIDIMAPVASLKASIPAIEAASRVGYAYYPYKPEVMHWFCKPSASNRTHHLHLVPFGSQLWQDRLAFRDALRASESLRTEYQALKQSLAQAHREDREAYTSAKGPFIERVLQATNNPTRAA